MSRKKQEVSLLNQPREEIFRKIWENKNNVKFFLQNNLSVSIISTLNLESLTKVPDTFLNSRDQENYSDILYLVKLKNKGACYIYLLFEYNKERKTSPLELLNYMVRIWKKHELNNTGKLIPIIPIILHNNNHTLFWKPNFASQFHTSKEFDRYIPHFQFKLFDLSSIFIKNFSFM